MLGLQRGALPWDRCSVALSPPQGPLRRVRVRPHLKAMQAGQLRKKSQKYMFEIPSDVLEASDASEVWMCIEIQRRKGPDPLKGGIRSPNVEYRCVQGTLRPSLDPLNGSVGVARCSLPARPAERQRRSDAM